jgi:NNP family nitrate/nitrite transporter-like MFS transporter
MQDTIIVTTAQQQRAMWLSTFAFTVCFAVWTIFSIIGIQIKKDLGLSETAFGLLIATPILTGSLTRLFLGIWADQFGGRLVLTLVMLCAAVATWMLTWAHTYPQFILGALFVGLAGGSFSVGVAYVSKWFPANRQGTALGIFGAGNVGAAVTKLIAPMIMVAAGWMMVAKVWAIAIAVIAILFYLFSQDDPSLAERRMTGAKPMPFREQMAPLKNIQVWRFALYYFFVFGGFVALALWLPHFLTGAYGLDIRTAGLFAAAYSIPASLFRIVGGWLSDKVGARTVMYWTFGVSALCTFVLSYPDTQYIVKGIHGDIHLHLAIRLIPFTMLVFVLGFFMSLGKAAVYKHIPVYYPNHVGSVGGVVGMIGGLGGFIMPIAFGAMNDLTGVWTSCFMLLFVVVAAALAWMHFAIRRMERANFPQIGNVTDLPEIINAAKADQALAGAGR